MQPITLNSYTWKPCAESLPVNDLPVLTAIIDGSGERNVQILKRQGRLWFTEDGSMYVYYEPTHWTQLPNS